MTAMKTFRVTVWDHSWFETTVRAISEHDALEKAEFRYAAARPASCKGFQLLDNHGDDWHVRQVPQPPRKGRGGVR
jgi:hypothetical protein